MIPPFVLGFVCFIVPSLYQGVLCNFFAKLRVQCFGNFDVFTPEGDHVRFERSKSKEVFAYLVHKQGSSCTTREIFAAIFEDAPYDKKLQNLLQTYIFAMIKSLRAVNAEDAVVRSYNALAVNPDVLDCDYYRFITGPTFYLTIIWMTNKTRPLLQAP